MTRDQIMARLILNRQRHMADLAFAARQARINFYAGLVLGFVLGMIALSLFAALTVAG